MSLVGKAKKPCMTYWLSPLCLWRTDAIGCCWSWLALPQLARGGDYAAMHDSFARVPFVTE